MVKIVCKLRGGISMSQAMSTLDNYSYLEFEKSAGDKIHLICHSTVVDFRTVLKQTGLFKSVERSK